MARSAAPVAATAGFIAKYEHFAGRAITAPSALLDQPDPELLDWHEAEVFRG